MNSRENYDLICKALESADKKLKNFKFENPEKDSYPDYMRKNILKLKYHEKLISLAKEIYNTLCFEKQMSKLGKSLLDFY